MNILMFDFERKSIFKTWVWTC